MLVHVGGLDQKVGPDQTIKTISDGSLNIDSSQYIILQNKQTEILIRFTRSHTHSYTDDEAATRGANCSSGTICGSSCSGTLLALSL